MQRVAAHCRRTTLLALSLGCLSVLAACQGNEGVRPPLPYVQKHQAFHANYRKLVDQYAKDHPGETASTMDLMWRSEDVMIRNGLNGNFPTTAP